MKGWKTWTGFGIVVVSQILKILGYNEIAESAELLGTGAIGVGIAHKIEKRNNASK